MFRKLFVVLFLLVFCSIAFGGGITDKHKAVIARQNVAGVSPCPSYYASAILSWDGDHTTGTNYGCNTAGDAIEFTNEDTFTISTDYGEGGADKGGFVDGNDTGLTKSQTADQYLDDDGAQTLWIRAYFDGDVAGNTTIGAGSYATTPAEDIIRLVLSANTKCRSIFVANSNTDTIDSAGAVTFDAWQNVAESWDYLGGDLSVYAAAAWTDSADVLEDAHANKINELVIGTHNTGSGAPGAGNEIWITDWAIVDGYKTACPF